MPNAVENLTAEEEIERLDALNGRIVAHSL